MSRASSGSSPSSSWMTHLPLVLLGLRSTVRLDAGCCPADVLYGCQLRLPGDLVCPTAAGPSSSSADAAFAQTLQDSMLRSRPLPPVRRGPPVAGHVPAPLARVSHVFLRVDAVRRPLTPPYVGPFPVLDRGPKTFKLLKSGKEVIVSIDRLKPAFLSQDVLPDSDILLPPPASARAGPQPRVDRVLTSSGRCIRRPERFQA